MSSVVSQLAQIPRGSHFRPIPSLIGADAGKMSTSILTVTPTTGAAPFLTYNSATVGVTGAFSIAPWANQITTPNPYGALSSGSAILKDLGETIVSSGRTFRRVQVLTEDLTGSTAWTAGPNGVWQASVEGVQLGSDAGDALYRCYYVEVGWRGVGTPQPVTRYG